MNAGLVGRGTNIWFDRTLVLSNNFHAHLLGKTKFPMTLFLPQNTLEAFLETKLSTLGVQVQRGRKVIEIRPTSNGIEVAFEDSSMISSKYLIGADGSKSIVSC